MHLLVAWNVTEIFYGLARRSRSRLQLDVASHDRDVLNLHGRVAPAHAQGRVRSGQNHLWAGTVRRMCVLNFWNLQLYSVQKS